MSAGENHRNSWSGTIGGFAAIILWSTTVAVARSLSEQLGAVTAAGAVYGAAAILAVGRLLGSNARWRAIAQLPREYLFACGALFVSYMLLLFLAIGLANDRQETLEIGLLNYLWPTLTLLLSLVLLGKRANILLLPGTILALAGVFLVLTHGASISWQSFAQNIAGNPLAYLLGLLAAIFWALYSALTSRWASGDDNGAVDLFLPVTALVMIFASMAVDEPRDWTVRSITEAAILGMITYMAYGLWDNAMRKGNVVLVAIASYLTPLFSTLIGCVYLQVSAKPNLWVGCGVLVAGSLLSWRSITSQD